MRRCLLVLGLFTSTYFVSAQKPMSIKMKNPVICYAAEIDNPLIIPAPAEYLRWKDKAGARTKSATIEVNYVGFESVPLAQNAFQAAIEIWESLLSSPVTIRINAEWKPLGANVLGSAIYAGAYANFKGAQKLNVFYPVAIAEKITGEELNDGDADIFASFNSAFDWHFDPINPPPAGKYDLTTVVLHEIGHGLGFAGTFEATSTQGEVGLQGTGIPIIYDVPIENGTNSNLIESFDSPSSALRTQLTSANLFFDSPTSGRPKLYAPIIFDGGSSISHIDENTFNGPPNALMTPQIAPMEQIRDPGVALNMLEDMGWSYVRINHQPVPNTENVAGPFTVTVTIQEDDDGYDINSVKLHHTLDGTNFTTVTMTATGNPDEFSATIPSTNAPQTYGYFISVKDNSNREFVNPGKIVAINQSQEQDLFVFETGPDTKAPKITHTPKAFLLDSDTQLVVEARITDNIGIASAMVEYSINNNPQTPQPLVLTAPQEDSIYTVTLNLGALTSGDEIKYLIRVIDSSVAGNTAVSPAEDFYSVNVVGLEPTQDSYANNFDGASDDFFGNGFSITTPAGFSNAAIHTTHPYPEGNGLPGDELEYIYQLKIPIRVKALEATLKFDEIVLVEPGESGSVFGSENFFDYVVVEGSKDGGITWTTVADGYDSRDHSPWLTRYNSAITGNNSTAVGDPSLFRSRTFDLQQKFDEGDEVVIRFRLFSDPFAAGWGWCIDNLKIQIDETPPRILHNHVDYLVDGNDALQLPTKVSDASGIKSLKLEYFVNNDPIETFDFDVNPPQSEYPFNMTGLSPLAVGDVFNYRFVATDSANLEGYFPAAGFLKVPIVNFSTTPVSTYSNNFNAASTDFVGNFFNISQPSGFANGAIHSDHNYSLGIGLTLTSDLIYTLTKPITISTENSIVRFDEVALVEGHAGGAVFGTPAFKDYVIVEGSKDGGETWNRFIDGYDAVEESAWLSAFNNQVNGTSGLYRPRFFDMTENGNFVPGDDVIIRFRLFSNETTNGWGWAIDNLYIQDPITSTEKELESAISVYPNPARENIIVEASGLTSPEFTIQLLNAQGQTVYAGSDYSVNGKMTHLISASTLPKGLYFVKISNERNTVIRKVVKMD